MNRVIRFEIQADEPERAIKFYENVFGWTIQKWEGLDADYWVVLTAEEGSKEPGISGALIKRPANTPPIECGTNAYVCTILVDEFDQIAQKIESAGGQIALPKFAIPGRAWQGYFIDTEGNTFGIYQTDGNAK